MKIRQHMPGSWDFEPQTGEYDSQESLLAIPFVNNFANQPMFHQFSVSDDLLMAEYREGAEWWVVGYLENKEGLTLPEWDSIAAVKKKGLK